MIKNFLNPKGHQNPISGSKVRANLLKGWISPIGGASAGEGPPCSLRSRLVCNVLCVMCYMVCVMCYVLCVIWYVLCVMCYVLCLMCCVICVMSYVLCLMSYVLCLMCCVLCLLCYVLCVMSYVLCLMSYALFVGTLVGVSHISLMSNLLHNNIISLYKLAYSSLCQCNF